MEFQSRGPTHVATLVPYNCSEKVSLKCRLVLVSIAGALDNVKRASSSVGRTLVNFLCITVMSCCLAMSLKGHVNLEIFGLVHLNHAAGFLHSNSGVKMS